MTRVYLGKDSRCATENMTATTATVRQLICRVEGLRHKMFMDKFNSSPRLFDDLNRLKINSCRRVQPNRKDMPHDWTKTTETVKGWRNVEDQWRFDCISLEGQMRSLEANMDPQPAEGNFCDDNNYAMKPHISEEYICTWGKPTILIVWPTAILRVNVPTSGLQNCFFHILDLTVLNSWIMLSSYGAKYTHQYFRLLLVRNLSEEAGKSQDRPTPRLVGRSSVIATNVVQLKAAITNTVQ